MTDVNPTTMVEIPDDVMKAAREVFERILMPDFESNHVNTIARALMAEREADKWQPIETAPEEVEVLAFHIRGQNWHQVIRSGAIFRSRWHSGFNQFLLDYTHWQPLPPPPASKGEHHDTD